MATQCTVQPAKQHFKEVHCVPLRASQSDSRVFRRLLGRGWLRWFAHPSSGAVCRACLAFSLDTLCLLPALQKWQLDFESFFFFFCILLCIICPSYSRTQLFLVPYRKGEMGGRG